MKTDITQLELEVFLQKYLGFQQSASVPGSYKSFRHQQTDTVVLLNWKHQDTPASTSTVAGVRRLLDEKGVISGKQFDEKLEKFEESQRARNAKK
jgi:hypothetical protein